MPLEDQLLEYAQRLNPELYYFMLVTRYTWMRGGEVAALKVKDVRFFAQPTEHGSLLCEFHFFIATSKTDVPGKGQVQIVKLKPEPLKFDLRDFVEYYKERQQLGPEAFLFPLLPATYRARQRALVHRIAAEQPLLLAPAAFNPDEYGLHSWRKTGARFAAQSGLSDYTIMELGRWKSLEFTKYARTSAEEAAARLADVRHKAWQEVFI